MQQSYMSSRYFVEIMNKKTYNKMDTSYHFLSEGASNHEKDSTDGGNKLQEDLRLTNKNRWKIQICVLGGEKSGRTSMLKEFDKHYSE